MQQQSTEANVQQHDKPDKVHAVVLSEKNARVLLCCKSKRVIAWWTSLSHLALRRHQKLSSLQVRVVSLAMLLWLPYLLWVSYAEYRRIFKSFLFVKAFSPQIFIEMIGAIHPHVCAMLDNMCNEAKAEMKQKHALVRSAVESEQSPLQMATG